MTPAYPTVGEVLEEVVLVVDASWGCRRRWSSGMACILVSCLFVRRPLWEASIVIPDELMARLFSRAQYEGARSSLRKTCRHPRGSS